MFICGIHSKFSVPVWRNFAETPNISILVNRGLFVCFRNGFKCWLPNFLTAILGICLMAWLSEDTVWNTHPIECMRLNTRSGSKANASSWKRWSYCLPCNCKNKYQSHHKISPCLSLPFSSLLSEAYRSLKQGGPVAYQRLWSDWRLPGM